MSTLTFSIIQTNLVWESPEENRSVLESKIESIPSGTEIIILPEMFTTAFSMNPTLHAETMEGETLLWMRRISQQKKSIIVGSVMISEHEQCFNRLIWMQPNGVHYTYDKRHLFSIAGEDEHYAAGNKRLITQVKGWKICPQICYDLRFPVWNRLSHADEYDLLLFVANWPSKRSLAWKTLLQARAIENQCYVIGVNRVGSDEQGNEYSGDSSIIDPLGDILYSKSDIEEIFTTTLSLDYVSKIRNQLPFSKDKDDFLII